MVIIENKNKEEEEKGLNELKQNKLISVVLITIIIHTHLNLVLS